MQAAAPSQLGPGTIVGRFIELLCEQNKVVTTDVVQNPFYLNHPPPITMTDFADRLQKFFACSVEAFVVTSVYLRRLYNCRPDLFSPRSAHKLFLAALTVAVKFTDDVACKQSHYARCGGIEVNELNALETKIVTEMKFNLFVSGEQYDQTMNILCHLTKLNQSSRLGPQADTTQQQMQLVRGSFG